MLEFFSGLGEIIGNINSWCVLPEIGPTTKMLSNSVLYGEIKTPFVFSLIFCEIWFLGASLKPFGKIKIPPTFKSVFLPFALICFFVVS